MRKLFVAALAASVLGLSVAAHAAETAPEPPEVDWSFDGIFGTYDRAAVQRGLQVYKEVRSEEHTSELQSLMRISYAVFCLKKKNNITKSIRIITTRTSINT